MSEVVICDISIIPVGEHWDKAIDDLIYDAAEPLTNKYRELIDAVYVGNMLSQYCRLQGNLGAYTADILGLTDTEAFWINNAEASGASALYEAVKAIRSGAHDVVLVGGVEKVTDVLSRELIEGLSLSVYADLVNYSGVTLAGLAALMAREYIKRFKIDRRYLSYLSVQDHDNALSAKHAQFHVKISIEKVLNSPLVSDPLSVFDVAPISDGAAFLLLMKREIADEYGLKYVSILGISMATQTMCIIDREDILEFRATRIATSKAVKQANIDLSDISILEINDDFSITGILSLEAIGLFNRGEAALAIAKGETARNGKYPVNTFGGLKARGHPLGATGIYQVCEIYMQLLGLAGDNQVKGAKYGLAQNYGGLDSISVVTILGR